MNLAPPPAISKECVTFVSGWVLMYWRKAAYLTGIGMGVGVAWGTAVQRLSREVREMATPSMLRGDANFMLDGVDELG